MVIIIYNKNIKYSTNTDTMSIEMSKRPEQAALLLSISSHCSQKIELFYGSASALKAIKREPVRRNSWPNVS